MSILYFDCIAGASGDMILGALVDAGVTLEALSQALDALHLADFELRAKRVSKLAFTATKVDVVVADDVPERHLSDILEIIDASALSDKLKARARAIFTRLGTAEAGIHGTDLAQVHLHELGGVDTIVDVVGTLVCLELLNVERVIVSPIPLGRGFIHGAHGQIPLPAPATLALLQGAPVIGSPLNVETVTPTGAVLLTSLADGYGPIPPMQLSAVGYGAGQRDLAIPNVLRVLIGEELAEPPNEHRGSSSHSHAHPHPSAHNHDHSHTHAHPSPHNHDRSHSAVSPDDTHLSTSTLSPRSCLDAPHLKVLETNIDDLNPEFYAHVMDRLFEAGALDVFLAPIQMKKNRPATLLRVLCTPEQTEAMTAILFSETSTLGIREHTVTRYALARTLITVETPYGPVRIKVATLPNGETKSAPEYEDCRARAKAHRVPIRVVYAAAQMAAQQQGKS